MARDKALAGYRVLDLMEEGSGLCAKTLGEWGAEVIKIEPPRGSRIRAIGPFYQDLPHPERSLFWFAYNTGKKSITLNINSTQGQEILRQLVRSAHFLVESFPAGFLDSLGLDYTSLSQVNPGLVMASITPFGQTGPRSRYKGCELVAEAMSGIVYPLGTPDRAPVRPMTARAGSVVCLIAEMEAAGGSLIASHYRALSGEGQHVDVSVQECISNLLQFPPLYWDTNRVILRRLGGAVARSARGVTTTRKSIFPCKDGYVEALLFGEWFEPMVAWMDSEGAAGDLKANEEHWKSRLTMNADPPISQEEIDHIQGKLTAFLAKRTKAEIYEQAEARGMGWGGVNTIGEVMKDRQLRERSFFVQLDHPELGGRLTYPGVPYRATETPAEVTRRAPLVGEHNEEIYLGELGLSKDNLAVLKESGVI